MKPFRGKPKKPKRSNGEIHRQRHWLRVGRRCLAVPFHGSRAGTLPCVDVRRSSSCTSPLVGRRDPLGVGLRRGYGDCRVAAKTARGKLPHARPAARRYAQRYQAAPRARRARRKRAPRYPEVRTQSRPRSWPAAGCYGATFDRPPSRAAYARAGIPVGDATALGTLRTRLETRTKESNMYASHWD